MLTKLSRQDILAQKGLSRGRGANQEYVQFLRGLKVSNGGKAIVADEGVSRQQVKNRLLVASKEAGVHIAFLRSSAEEVIFEIRDSPTPRRGRRPKEIEN